MTWHDFLTIETSRNKHRDMTWLNYITIHPGTNIGLQYIRNTDEYIPELQIHQHSLLTRKVFSRHNLSAQVFFFVSSRSSSGLCHLQIHLHLQVIFICKSSSSVSHLHWIWIISRSGSSWNIITWSGSSLAVITGSQSSLDLDHPWCYLMILLITGIYTEPVLFHARCIITQS